MMLVLADCFIAYLRKEVWLSKIIDKNKKLEYF